MAQTCYSNARECSGCMTCQEQESVYACRECLDDINDGESYIELDGTQYHQCCVPRWAMLECLAENFTDREMLELLLERELVEVKVAEKEVAYA